MKKNQSLFTLLLAMFSLVALSGCGRMGASVSNLEDSSALQDPTKKTTEPTQAVTDPGTAIAEDSADSANQETSDNYESPFDDINNKFDASAPEVRVDTTPQGEVKNQAIGTFQKGYLQNASNLFAKQLAYGDKAPFSIIYPGRKTFYGTADMISMIDYLAQCLQSLVSGLKLLIGDISREHGQQLGTHKSHQIGLDADIAYIQAPAAKVASFSNVVAKEISKSVLQKEQLYLFQFAVLTQNVDRIFVHPTIKTAMCKTALDLKLLEKDHEVPSIQETLRRLIRDKDHGTHFHLRLKCSKAQPNCHPMAEPAAGTGC